MKALLMTMAFVVIAIAGIAQSPQSSVEQFMKKYEGKAGVTYVDVSEKLFEMLASMEMEGEDMAVIGGIKGVKVLTFETEDASLEARKMYDEVMSKNPFKGYEELVTVTAEDNVKVMAKQIDKEKISELVVIAQSEHEFVLVLINGVIDLNNLGEMKSIQIDGLEHLDKIEKK